jgi:uncharacterized membrane protein YfhO
VDGKNVPVKIANFNFMAFEINAGRHEIRLRYAPSTFYFALGITVLGLILFMGVLGWLFLRGKARLW